MLRIFTALAILVLSLSSFASTFEVDIKDSNDRNYTLTLKNSDELKEVLNEIKTEPTLKIESIRTFEINDRLMGGTDGSGD